MKMIWWPVVAQLAMTAWGTVTAVQFMRPLGPAYAAGASRFSRNFPCLLVWRHPAPDYLWGELLMTVLQVGFGQCSQAKEAGGTVLRHKALKCKMGTLSSSSLETTDNSGCLPMQMWDRAFSSTVRGLRDLKPLRFVSSSWESESRRRAGRSEGQNIPAQIKERLFKSFYYRGRRQYRYVMTSAPL